MAMSDSAKPLALVTGASSGIGYELARQFAAHGFDLMTAAEDVDIWTAAGGLAELGAQTECVQVDLATYEGVEKLQDRIECAGRPLEAAAINAGIGLYGLFARTELEDEVRLIRLNVESSVHLAKYIVQQMSSRHRGRLLFTSSIAGTMPTPLEAVYGASEAFLLSFADSLRNELKNTGVTVTAALPGPTDTQFFERAGLGDTKAGTDDKAKDSPVDVAKQAFGALMAGKSHVLATSSAKTKLEGVVGKYLPENLKAEWHRREIERIQRREKRK